MPKAIYTIQEYRAILKQGKQVAKKKDKRPSKQLIISIPHPPPSRIEATGEYQIEIIPMGKPRMTQRDKWLKPPRNPVLKYRNWCDTLRKQCDSLGFELTPELTCTFVIPMPKSWSGKKKERMDGQPHQQRPDIDNICKAVMDALAKEDSYVYALNCKKIWGRRGLIIFK